MTKKKTLTSSERKNLASSSFVFPSTRRYPIHDVRHARNALSRVSQFGTASEKLLVRAAVRRRFPSVQETKHKWSYKVDNKIKGYGQTDYQKREIRVNVKKSKSNPSRVRPITEGATKYPDVLDTIVHETLHKNRPRMREKTVRKATVRMIKSMTPAQKLKYYLKVKGR